MNNIEALLNELGRTLMCSDNSSYNGVSELESSMSYQGKIDNLYVNAVSDLYGLNENQLRIVIGRIDEVQEQQMSFDVPSQETVDSMLRDYNSQPEGKRNKSLLADYRYCKFVLECVSIQQDYIERFASLVKIENNKKDVTNTDPGNSKVEEIKDDAWLTVEDVVSIFHLPKNNIKSRKWRIEHDFPYKGFDEKKGSFNKVVFNSNDVEEWINGHK